MDEGCRMHRFMVRLFLGRGEKMLQTDAPTFLLSDPYQEVNSVIPVRKRKFNILIASDCSKFFSLSRSVRSDIQALRQHAFYKLSKTVYSGDS